MTIKTEELRKFLSTSGQIKANPLAAYLDSIKIESIGADVFFTKTNNNIWCRYNYSGQPQAPEIFLINERMLNGIILTSSEHEIEIKEDYGVTIISGESVQHRKKQDLSMFPITPQFLGDKIKIPRETVQKIRIASKHISNNVNKTAMNFVNVGPNGIFAFNGAIAYFHDTKNLPEIFFDEEPLGVLRTNDDLFYWSSPSYDFFQIDGFYFGFIKSIVKPMDFVNIFKQSIAKGFSFKKEDLMNFCTLVQYSKKSIIPIATFESSVNDASVLNLNYIDSSMDININNTIKIEANGFIEKFEFNVDSLMVLLKSLPYETLVFSKLQNGHYIAMTHEDDGYKGIIAYQKK